jgi:hypothetical protein
MPPAINRAFILILHSGPLIELGNRDWSATNGGLARGFPQEHSKSNTNAKPVGGIGVDIGGIRRRPRTME